MLYFIVSTLANAECLSIFIVLFLYFIVQTSLFYYHFFVHNTGTTK